MPLSTRYSFDRISPIYRIESSLVKVDETPMAYTIAACQRQTSGSKSNDCGVFAIAVAVSLAFSEDPCSRLYDSVANKSQNFLIIKTMVTRFRLE